MGELPVPLGQSQEVPFCVHVCEREFLHWNAPELPGKGQSQSQVD